MNKPKKLVPYLISFGAATAIFLAVILSNKIWTHSGYDVFRLLSDACMVAGVLIGGVGALLFASNSGTFDMLIYGIKHLFDLFRPNARNEKYRDFYEYKKAKGDRNRPFGHLLVAGLVFLLLAGVFSLIWYQMNS